MKTFKLLYQIVTYLFLLIIFALFDITQFNTALAQTCSGTTSCTSNLYYQSPISDQYCPIPFQGGQCNSPQLYICYWDCSQQQFTWDDTGYSCSQLTGGICGACVTNDQTCGTGNDISLPQNNGKCLYDIYNDCLKYPNDAFTCHQAINVQNQPVPINNVCYQDQYDYKLCKCGTGGGTTPPPNPTPTPAPNGNVGWVDSGSATSCHDITGWACGPNQSTVKVDLYDGPYNGSSSNFITEVTANSATSDGTQPDCNSNQGFDFPSSSLPQDGSQHNYYVYINGDANALTNSPGSATCTNACQSHPNGLAVNTFCNGAQSDATMSWDAVTGATQYTVDFNDNGGPTYTRTTTNNSFTINRFPQGASAYVDVYTSQPCTSGKNSRTFTALVCAYTISGTIYKDYNHNGIKDTADPGYSTTVTLDDTTTNTTVASTTSDPTTGAYSFPGIAKGDNYTVTATIQTGTKASTTNPVTITNLSQNTTANFGITPLYTISGIVFNDVDLSHCYNPAAHGCTYNNIQIAAGNDTTYTQGSHIVITGTSGGTVNTTTNAVNGSYSTAQVLTSGTYTVKYDTATTPLPAGYRFVGPSSWSVTLGDPTGGSPTCNTGASTDATCTDPNNGSIATLNFGVTNENVWSQFCSDARFNAGYSQPIPSTANCGGTSAAYALYCPTNTNPGVLFSGSTDPNYGAGIGASINNLEVGNSLFPENFTPRIPNTISSSYSFVSTTLNNASPAPTPLTSICPNLTNCVLSENTLGGVYTATAADGPVSISVSNADGTFQLGKASYTFVIGGNLTFTSNVLMQNGYSASFVSGGDIHVASNVGESDWTSLTPDLEGLFSTDGNFSIDAANASGQQCTASGQPKELKLNIVGSVIANAANKGGSFVNNREGCLQDLQCPATTVTANPLLILHAPGALKPPYSFWQELNP